MSLASLNHDNNSVNKFSMTQIRRKMCSFAAVGGLVQIINFHLIIQDSRHYGPHGTIFRISGNINMSLLDIFGIENMQVKKIYHLGAWGPHLATRLIHACMHTYIHACIHVW